MKSRLIDAAAFVIGAILAFMQGGAATDYPWLTVAHTILCPGYVVGLPLFFLVGAIGLASFGFFFFLSILVNGLIFGLASYLIRNALKGQRAARLALALGMGVWITWGVVWTVQAWPKPPAPVILASPLAGRWNGVLHAPRGDRSMVLVCHPRADSTLDGYLYVHGWDMGPFENGVYARDSLHFEIVGYNYSAHFDSTAMAMVVTVSGMSNEAEFRFASADTSRPAPAPVDFASPLAGRWDGVLRVQRGDIPAVLICHPRTDTVLDGYLYITGMDVGRLEQGIWAPDSLHFEVERFQYSARFDSTTMAVARSGNGLSQTMALRYVGADTTRPAIPSGPVHLP
jgi:hypothetical protein